MAVIFALALRAACGQQPYPGAPPYRPPPLAPVVQPAMAQSPASTSLRYPLPQTATRRITDGSPAAEASSAAEAAPPQITAPPASPPSDVFGPGQIVARVGDKFIFAGDVAPIVDQLLDQNLAKAKSAAEREQIQAAREGFSRGVLKKLIEIKIKYLAFEREFQRNIPDAKKRTEKLRDIDRNLRSRFEPALEKTREKVAQADAEELQKLAQRDFVLPRLAVVMRDHQAETQGDLDAVLRQYGTSLDREVRLFIEDIMGNQIIGRGINLEPVVSHEEMLDYYREHAADYAVPAKASFEILTVKWANHPSPDAARNKLAAMGNQVIFGASFAEIARKQSEEPNAQEGGSYESITPGALASHVVDQAVFTLETGKLSQIIEDDVGCHIVRVLARQPAGQVSFLQAQEKIKETIRTSKINADYRRLLEELQARTAVWTIYDSERPERP